MAVQTKQKHVSVGKSVAVKRRAALLKKHRRLRKKISGDSVRPRLVVNRSARHIHVQLVDDTKGQTLAAASTMEAAVRKVSGDKKAKSSKVGELLAERAKSAGIKTIVFDRGGFNYGGRIAALATAAREGGLEF